MLYICSDHGGFELKKHLIQLFEKENIEYQDMGPTAYNPDDDYPDFVLPTVNQLVKDLQKHTKSCAILICRNGVGVSIMANRFSTVRCALTFTPKHAQSSKVDDDTNVLALPADYITSKEAESTVLAWLASDFSQAPRHIRRLAQIDSGVVTRNN